MPVLAGTRGVDELKANVGDAIDKAIAPDFRRLGARRMIFYLVGHTVDDADPSTIGFPSGITPRKTFVGEGDATIVLIFILVFCGIGRRIAVQPERFNETLALFIGSEPSEGGALIISDDVGDIFIQPVAPTLPQRVVCVVNAGAVRTAGALGLRQLRGEERVVQDSLSSLAAERSEWTWQGGYGLCGNGGESYDRRAGDWRLSSVDRRCSHSGQPQQGSWPKRPRVPGVLAFASAGSINRRMRFTSDPPFAN